MKPPANKEFGRGTVIAVSASKQVSIRLRVLPLPAEVTEFLARNSNAIKRLYSERQAAEQGRQTNGEQDGQNGVEQVDADENNLVDTSKIMSLEEFKKRLQKTFAVVKGQREVWSNVVEQITCFGPRRTGPNLLIDATKESICARLYVFPSCLAPNSILTYLVSEKMEKRPSRPLAKHCKHGTSPTKSVMLSN